MDAPSLRHHVNEVVGVARETLDTALASAEDLHPERFVAHLRSETAGNLEIDLEGAVLTEVVYVPESKPVDVFRVLGVDSLPRRSSIVGTVASNPDGDEPESEDYTRFANRGRVHLMLYPPYDADSWTAYTSEGEERDLRVLDVGFPEEEETGSWLW